MQEKDYRQFIAEEIGESGHLPEAFARYAGIWSAIYTLFMCISGGISWVEAAEPLLTITPLFGVIFSFYVCFTVFCVLNVVTGIFVESASNMIAQDQEMMMMEELARRKQWLDAVKEAWTKADKDGSGLLNVEEFVAAMGDT